MQHGSSDCLRVTYLSPSAGLGGAERCLITVIESVRRSGLSFSPRVLLLEAGPLIDELKRIGVPYQVEAMPAGLATLGDSAASMPGSPGRRGGAGGVVLRLLTAAPAVAGLAGRLRRTVAATRPHLVHSNGLKTHLLCPVLASMGGIDAPIVWHLHDFASHRPLAARGLRVAAAALDRVTVIANSTAVATDVRPLLPGRVHVRTILNATDLTRFSPGPAADPPVLPPAPESAVRVGLVATYARWKGQDRFIEAIAGLPSATRQAARFYVIGGPIYRTAGSQWSREELVAQADALGVGELISFVDFLPDPASVYRELDVVVHASTRPEPFGLTIAEAMACGRALIVTAAGGAVELFEPESEAIGVPPGDPKALSAAMARLIHDRTLRQRLGVAARSRAERTFAPERLGVEVASLYRDLVGARRRPSSAGL